MSTYTERQAFRGAGYYCGVVVARRDGSSGQCRRRATLLFQDGATVKACACKQHRETVREALRAWQEEPK